jgi:hypothetical protein
MSNRKNPYLFYTEYYIISGAYHVVNVVHDVLTYTASCSDNIKGYLHSKVINKKILLEEIVNNNNNSAAAAKNNDADVDEDGFVVIRMRRPKIKNDATVTTTTISALVSNTDTDTKSTVTMNLDHSLDKNAAHSIINKLLNDILDNLEIHTI